MDQPMSNNCPEVIDDLCGERYDLREEQARIAQASRDGMEIKRGDEHTLTLDLDSDDALETFKCRVVMLDRKGFVPHVEITRSKSGNYHAVVTIAEQFKLDEPMRIALQSILGSDWKREMLGCLRYLNNQVPPSGSLLFRPQPLQHVPFEFPNLYPVLPVEGLTDDDITF